MNESQKMIGELVEAFSGLPHILTPQERRPYFDKGEAEIVAANLTELDGVERVVNFRTLERVELSNRFPLSLLPTRNINDLARPASLMIGADGDSHDVNLLMNREHYWIDRTEE